VQGSRFSNCSQRQMMLEKIVPEHLEDVKLWDWKTIDGQLFEVPSELHLEWICWGYSPDPDKTGECANGILPGKLVGFL
jgi:hypothetical protein